MALREPGSAIAMGSPDPWACTHLAPRVSGNPSSKKLANGSAASAEAAIAATHTPEWRRMRHTRDPV